MNRRQLFQSLAACSAGILLPETVRAYSFVGGWRLPRSRFVAISTGHFIGGWLEMREPLAVGDAAPYEYFTIPKPGVWVSHIGYGTVSSLRPENW